ncbi:MAG: hypothetical protein WBE76_20785 [Terracidiphilus sp.]
MKLVRSDSPEVANCIAASGTLACWGWSAPALVYTICIASVPGLLITIIASQIVSVRTATWLGVLVVLALNGYLFWRGWSPRLNWVIAGCADQVFVRLFVRRGRGKGDLNEPDVLMLEASEIASMSIKTVEVFLYGPKPKIVEWLAIEPSHVVVEGFSNQIRGLLNPDNPGKQVYVANEEARLTMKWEWCRPDLRTFLQEVARECPSVLIAPEEHSELDLNRIWNRVVSSPDAQERRMLVEAKRLGFGCECVGLLNRHQYILHLKAAEYLAEIEREEAECPTLDPPVK